MLKWQRESFTALNHRRHGAGRSFRASYPPARHSLASLRFMGKDMDKPT